MAFGWSDRVYKGIAVAANKAGISHKEGEEIVDMAFSQIKKWINDVRMPAIRILKFGVLKPSLWKINRGIRYRLTMYRKLRITPMKLRAFLARFWPVRNRLVKEKKGIITSKEWKKKENWMEAYNYRKIQVQNALKDDLKRQKFLQAIKDRSRQRISDS